MNSGGLHHRECKLLVIPIIKDGDGNLTCIGSAQFEYAKNLATKWNVQDNIMAITFDITVANTGIIRGAATRMEAY